MAGKKEEKAVETLLNDVHKNHVSLQDDDIARNGEHFRKVLDHLILLMKEEDVLFNTIYSRTCGAGSYYDGLKVGKPEEFDVCIVIRLPINYEEVVIENANPVPAGYTKVKITRALDLLRHHPDWTSTYRCMDKWRDKDGFLLQSEFRQWMEGVVNKALNRLEKNEPNCFKPKSREPKKPGRGSESNCFKPKIQEPKKPGRGSESNCFKPKIQEPKKAGRGSGSNCFEPKIQETKKPGRGSESNCFRPKIQEPKKPGIGLESNCLKPKSQEPKKPGRGSESSCFKPKSQEPKKHGRGSESNCFKLKIQEPNKAGGGSEYTVSLKKSGPALTFAIKILADNVVVDVDFVPVIEFSHPKWPPHHVCKLDDQLLEAKKTSWFIVPKPVKTAKHDGTMWRLSFHEQERYLINSRGSLKPVCRLLKKLRDSQNLNIASYYLKTLFLWEIEKNKDPDFWMMKQGPLFMHMLKVLEQSLKCGKIPYYWDKRYNLIEGLKDSNIQNLAGRMKNIIADIEKNVSRSPLVIAKYILSREEFEALNRNCGTDVAGGNTTNGYSFKQLN